MYALDAQLDTYKWLLNNPDPASKILGLTTSHVSPSQQNEIFNKLVVTMEFAETFHVDREWTMYMSSAIRDLMKVEPHPVLHKTDLMAPRGFAYFEDPLPLLMIPPDQEAMGREYAPIRAVAWTNDRGIVRPKWIHEKVDISKLDPETAGEYIRWVQGEGVLMWPFVDTPWIMEMDAKANPERHDWAEREVARRQLDNAAGSPLTGFDMYSWSYNGEWQEIDHYEDRPPFSVDPSNSMWRRTMFAFWHLTAQYVVSTRPSRGVRRRWEREFPKHPPENLTIRHVTLRRSKPSSKSDGAEDFEYSHRFKVRGHWRNQYYPSEDTHRTIWIDPFIKGPEDKPLVIKRSVFDVKR